MIKREEREGRKGFATFGHSGAARGEGIKRYEGSDFRMAGGVFRLVQKFFKICGTGGTSGKFGPAPTGHKPGLGTTAKVNAKTIQFFKDQYAAHACCFFCGEIDLRFSARSGLLTGGEMVAGE